MSKGSRRNQPAVEEEVEEEEDPRSPSGGGEGGMIAMFRMLMEEQRKAECLRESERKREEDRREEAREAREREAAREKEEREQEAARVKEEREREAAREREERQIAFEQHQYEQQMALMKAQVKLGEKANKLHRDSQDEDQKRNRVLIGISGWKEGEDLEEFLLTVERRLRAAEIREGEWMSIVEARLSGKIGTAWQDIVATGCEYQEAKNKLLKMCGYTPRLAADGFFGFKPEQSKGLTADQLYHRGLQLLRRMVAPHKATGDVEFAIMRGWVGTIISKRARMLDLLRMPLTSLMPFKIILF